jgi:hypothetical protein
MSRIKCFFVEDTGKYKERFTNGVKTSEVPIYRRTDTGEEIGYLSELPAGAMWFADWYDKSYCKPQLEHVLVVKTPGGDWVVDAQSSNCTMSDDFKQEKHHCWIIEGELPNITVSKNGKTCAAGGGSILIGSYHGFLRNGYLEQC